MNAIPLPLGINNPRWVDMQLKSNNLLEILPVFCLYDNHILKDFS